jgi:hypothetical protein
MEGDTGMTITIEIILTLVAFYCGANWLLLIYWYYSGQLLDSEFEEKNRHAFMLGLCCVLALGFLGLILK